VTSCSVKLALGASQSQTVLHVEQLGAQQAEPFHFTHPVTIRLQFLSLPEHVPRETILWVKNAPDYLRIHLTTPRSMSSP
jgi:hypothetical protein